MYTPEIFASEWQNLQNKRQELSAEVDRTKRKLHGLTEEATMKSLLEDKTRLEKELPLLKTRIAACHETLNVSRQFLETRERALTDKNTREKLKVRLKLAKERLAKLESLSAPDVILENERKGIWETEAPLEEVRKAFAKERSENEQTTQEMQNALDETQNQITAIEEHYRQTKACLKKMLQEAEKRCEDFLTEEIEWGTQSRTHLEWMLLNVPAYRSHVCKRYKERFPHDPLPETQPRIAAEPTMQELASRFGHHRPKKPASTPAPQNDTPAPEQPWTFWITFQANAQGQELPTEKETCLTRLRSALQDEGYHNIDPTLIHRKLVAVAQMTTQQRLLISMVVPITGEAFSGWRKLEIGKKTRLFLWIDEKNRHIRCCPRPRKSAYEHG